jgi:hypothetical protein
VLRRAEASRVQGKWEKAAEGYHLVGKDTPAPTAAAKRPPSAAAQPAPGGDAGFNWVIPGSALGILLCLGAVLLVWKRRKSVQSN